jgi:hypothetical protein
MDILRTYIEASDPDVVSIESAGRHRIYSLR